MDFLGAFTQFANWLRPKIPQLITANRDLRNEIRGVINELCADLTDGLDLVLIRLRAALRVPENERASYLLQSQQELYKSFSEFRICANLRSLEDRLNSLFDPMKIALNITSASEVCQLVSALEDHERIIFDMIQSTYSELHVVASSGASSKFTAEIHKAISDCEDKRAKVTAIGRSLIDVL